MYDRVFQEFNGSHMAEHQQQAPQQQPLKNGFNNSTVMATSNNGKSKYVSPPMSASNLNDIREQQLLTGHTEMDEIDRLEAELMANSFPNNSNNVMGDAGAEWQSQVQQQQDVFNTDFMQPQAYIGVMSPSAHSEDEYQGGGGDFHDMSGQEESQSGPIRDWKEKQRDPKWDKSYESKRKVKGVRGHGINLALEQRAKFSKPYPDDLNRLLKLLTTFQGRNHLVDNTIENSENEGITAFTQLALSKINNDTNSFSKKIWRVWLPTDIWSRFSVLKASCCPAGVTTVQFTQLLLELKKFEHKSLTDLVVSGILEIRRPKPSFAPPRVIAPLPYVRSDASDNRSNSMSPYSAANNSWPSSNITAVASSPTTHIKNIVGGGNYSGYQDNMSMIASPQSQGQDLTGGNNIYNQIGYVSPMSDYSEASDLSTNLSSNNNYYIPHNTAAAGTSSHPDDNVQNLLNMILYGLTDSSSSSGGAELSNAAVATSTTSPAHSGADMFSATPLFDIGASSSSSSPEQQQRNLGTGGNYVIFQAEGIFESAERALREIKMDPEQELISRKREKGKSARKTLGGESTSITTEGGKKKPSTKKMLKSFAKKSISSVLDFAASKIATPASLPAAKSERNEVTQRKLGDASENLKADISRLSSTAKETSSSSPNKKLTMGFLLKKMKKAGGTKGAKKLIREVYEEYPDLFEDSLYNSGTTGMTRSPSQDSLEDTCLTADLESMFTTNLESSSQNVSTTNLSRESGKVMQRPGSPGKSISHMRDWSRDRLELKSAGSSDKLSSSSAVVNSKAAANDGASMIAVPAAPLQPAASSTSRIQRFFSRVGGGGGSNKSNDSYSDRNNNNSSTDYSKLQLPNRRMSAQSVNTVNTRCSVNSFNLLSILTPSSGGSNNSYPILGKKVTRSIRYEGSHESVEEGSNGGDEADLIMEMESLAVNSDSKTIDVLVNEWWDNPTGPDFEKLLEIFEDKDKISPLPLLLNVYLTNYVAEGGDAESMAAVFSCLLVGNRVTKAEAWDNLLACIPFSEKKLNELPESINLLISELVAQRVLLIGELEQLQLSLDAAFGEEEPEEEEEEEEQN